MLHRLLQCPYCQTLLNLEGQKKTQLLPKFGIVSCKCDSYPIVEHVIFCKKDDSLLHRKIVNHINTHHYFKAVWLSLKGHHFVLKFFIFVVYILKERGIHIKELSLLYFLKTVGPGRSWFEYLLKSSSRNTLKTASALISKHNQVDDILVDIGCGWGYLGSILNEQLQTKVKIIAIDKSMLFVLCAQMFHPGKNVIYIASDIELGYPLSANSATKVLFLDSFAWVYNKNGAIKESHRVLNSKGSLMIVNVHQPAEERNSWGYGIAFNLLKSYLKPYFAVISPFSNTLQDDGNIKLVSKIDSSGYSCLATKIKL